MSSYHKPDVNILQELKDIANKLRINSIKATTSSNSGHPTSCASMAEIMSVLFFHTMRYKVSAPRDPNSDRFILSKGHSAPILYAAWAEAGLFPEADLLNLRKIDNDLEGHPTPRLNFVDVATGSLGQGLSVACGMAYVGKYYDKSNYKVYCLIGDGESAEGSIWEAMSFAGVKKLNNLIAIFDINRLGQSEPTAFQHDMDVYKNRAESFGFITYVVDGHDIEALCKAFHEASQSKDKPTAILAKTLKGKGFPGIEDEENWHGKPLGAKAEDTLAAIQALIKNSGPTQIVPQKPLKDDVPAVNISNISLSSPPQYSKGDKVATRQAYGTALAKLAQSNPRVIALDGDTKNSTFSNAMLKVDPKRYIECFIAEQNLVGVAIGAACRGRTVPFCSTFAAFFTRAFDQLRMGAISQTNVNCVGSHSGVSIGEDGPSQMALEDLSMFRSIPTSTVFYPSDAVSTERAIEMSANTEGICFVRTSRPATKVIYDNNHKFEIGKSSVIRKSSSDKVLIIGIEVRVLDPFTIKPIDKEGIIKNAKECGGRIVVVEDHYPEGGIGEAVKSAVALERDIVVSHLAVTGVPRSGKAQELLDMFGISAKHIVKAVKEIASV
ncbi:Transketolase [Armadillidium nasatum]|uniref:transketolase n=2 Tax=Armadillidium nasatum TaxID=96803 RepID=A0A5N5TM20_9CRUS|nr:Transketolase [Armadillidium nasatum]